MKDPEESGDFWLGYHLFHKSGMTPSQYIELSTKEKGILLAWIDIYSKEMKKAEKKHK
ncbi:hypothetical protein AAK938_01275 [Aerococcaceae bacterium 50-4]